MGFFFWRKPKSSDSKVGHTHHRKSKKDSPRRSQRRDQTQSHSEKPRIAHDPSSRAISQNAAGPYHMSNRSEPHFAPVHGYPESRSRTPQSGGHHQLVVNNHYYVAQPPQHYAPRTPVPHASPSTSNSIGRFAASMVELTRDVIPVPQQLCEDTRAAWQTCTSLANGDMCAYFGNIMTMIDGDKLRGDEKDVFSYQPPSSPTPGGSALVSKSSAHLPGEIQARAPSRSSISKKSTPKQSKNPATDAATSVVAGNYFSKVELYANSKLPRGMPRLAVYIPTWPLLCLAAQYSQRVYETPKGSEADSIVSGDWRSGTKAMCIKSIPMDHMNTIVFAIRGTASFMDWTVNLNTEPTAPTDFLDDPGNLCHAGFLSVARRMVKPVAERLRQLLREDPSRGRDNSYSLLITGHSAGGAVAALLYSHMLSQTAGSELSHLVGCFKRVHCVTFGAPPVSLLPLQKPDRPSLRKSLFMSIVNEGDPVARADKAYVKSLLDLLSSAPPSSSPPQTKDSKTKKVHFSSSSSASSTETPSKPTWRVPACTLSNAGRIVVLRSGNPHNPHSDRKTVRERLAEGVAAVTCTDQQLRGVIWGDPVCHFMSLYAGRLEVLAVGAVTAQIRE